MQGAAAISGSPGDAQGWHAVDTTVKTIATLNQVTLLPHNRDGLRAGFALICCAGVQKSPTRLEMLTVGGYKMTDYCSF